MVFSSPLFIFLFLPVVLAVYFVLPKRYWNAWLLLASLIFYAWGERAFTVVMLASIVMNYSFGLLVEHYRGRPPMRWVMALAVVGNLLLLIGFKYANFLVNTLNSGLSFFELSPIYLAPVHLPIGISFFTFHALSYVIDIYRNKTPGQRDFIKVALYVTLFPQLIAGPILRFHNVANQFVRRTVTAVGFGNGVKLFLVGLGKKVLIANTLAVPADAIFSAPWESVSPGAAWLGAICYTLQLYFDFSGYSDMALGLGRMFGFRFPENFNYPYISSSIKEFWRRWHISLSTWFRDYLYIPLGGNRVSPLRSYFNLAAVFLLCGLWHGASFTFILWGAYHGAFLIFERVGLERILNRLWWPLTHVYAMLVVIVGWVFFRADNLPQAAHFLGVMFGMAQVDGESTTTLVRYLTNEVIVALVAGIIASTPLPAKLWRYGRRSVDRVWMRAGLEAGQGLALLIMFLACLTYLASGTYNPFIYFRF